MSLYRIMINRPHVATGGKDSIYFQNVVADLKIISLLLKCIYWILRFWVFFMFRCPARTMAKLVFRYEFSFSYFFFLLHVFQSHNKNNNNILFAPSSYNQLERTCRRVFMWRFEVGVVDQFACDRAASYF